jgi:hypothetical protein
MANDEMFEDELTSDELAAFRDLSTERMPPAELKDKTVSALIGTGRLRPTRRFTPRVMLMLATAASVVFVAGAGLGYEAAMRQVKRKSVEAVAPATSRAVARADASDTADHSKRQVVWF